MIYNCERCGYSTDFKQSLKNHLNRTIKCRPVLVDKSVDILLEQLNHKDYNDITYKCDFCNKCFNSCSSKSRHKKTCKKKPSDNISELNDIINNLSESNKKLHEEIDSIKKISTTIHNINNIQQNNNNNITIQLKSFGFENIKHLESDKEYMTKCLLNKDVMRLIENIHCDVEHPENVNVKIKSTKKELMETYIDGRWIISDQEETLDELLNKGYRILNFFRHRNKDHILKECEDDEGELHEMQDWLEDLYSNTKMRKPLKRKMLILFMNNKTLFLQKEENIIISDKEEKNIPIKNIVFPNEIVDNNESNENIIIQDEENNDDDSVISDRSYEPEEMSPEEAAKYTQSVWDPTKYLKNTK